MTVEECKKHLKKIFEINKSVCAKEETKQKLYETATRVTAIYSFNSSNSTANKTKFQDILIEIADAINELDFEIEQLAKLQLNINALIKTVQEPEYRQVLELRYVSLKTWEEIAIIIDKDEKTARRRHQKALEILCSKNIIIKF